MASSLPSLQVRKGSAVNEFLGRLIEIMAEVGTRSSMTSNHEIEIVYSTCIYSTCTVKLRVHLPFEPLFIVHAIYRLGLMYHARSNLPCSRYTNEIYAQARIWRAKRATLLVINNYDSLVPRLSNRTWKSDLYCFLCGTERADVETD